MAISMRELFHRRRITDEIISLRHFLANHPGSLRSLREAHKRLTTLNEDDGFRMGCRLPASIKIDAGIKTEEVGQVLPSWVPIRPPGDNRAQVRLLEGVLVKSRITSSDFPLKPWHTFYDWNFFVEVDPQYRYLLNDVTRNEHSKEIFPEEEVRDIIECEWDTAFVPFSALPPVDSRVWILGRWIFDCGHPKDGQHDTEIHPPKAIAWFRSEAVQFRENRGPTRANNAVVYIGVKGGYIDQDINDQDYTFDLHLPPKPHPDAVPLKTFQMTTDVAPVDPIMVPFPAVDPKLFRVTIPLRGVSSSLLEYGAIISCGWSDPAGTETRKTRRIAVEIESITRILPVSRRGQVNDERWLLLVGINGRWHRQDIVFIPATDDHRGTEGGRHPDPEEVTVDLHGITAELALHQDDLFQITACGFIKTDIFGFIGRASGVAPSVVGDRNTLDEAKEAAGRIRDTFASDIHTFLGLNEGNIPIQLFSKKHSFHDTGTFNESSLDHPGPREDGESYVLRYTVLGVTIIA